jgi:hypothetical protein
MGQLGFLDDGPVDVLVGRRPLPTDKLERLDNWQLEHQRALDLVDVLHGRYHGC